jgi:hypothetical protein
MMDKSALTAMLTAASEHVEDQRFAFADAQDATLLLALDGALLNVERLRAVTLGEHYIIVDAERETLYLDAASVVGIRVKAKGPEGTGFIKT